MKTVEVKNFLEEVWENIGWEGMEMALYADGDSQIRQEGNTGEDEDEIVFKIALSSSYWNDSQYVDENNEKIENEKEAFMDDMKTELTAFL